MSAFARSFNLSAAGVNHAAALDDLLGYLLVGRAQGVEWSDWPRRTSSIDLKGMLNRKAAGQVTNSILLSA